MQLAAFVIVGTTLSIRNAKKQPNLQLPLREKTSAKKETIDNWIRFAAGSRTNRGRRENSCLKGERGRTGETTKEPQLPVGLETYEYFAPYAERKSGLLCKTMYAPEHSTAAANPCSSFSTPACTPSPLPAAGGQKRSANLSDILQKVQEGAQPPEERRGRVRRRRSVFSRSGPI